MLKAADDLECWDSFSKTYLRNTGCCFFVATIRNKNSNEELAGFGGIRKAKYKLLKLLTFEKSEAKSFEIMVSCLVTNIFDII